MAKTPEFIPGETVYFMLTIVGTTSSTRTLRKGSVITPDWDLNDWFYTVKSTKGEQFKLNEKEIFSTIEEAKAYANTIIKAEVMTRQGEMVDIQNLSSETV